MANLLELIKKVQDIAGTFSGYRTKYEDKCAEIEEARVKLQEIVDEFEIPDS